MKTLSTLNQIIAAATGNTLYIRWSRGPELDRKQGRSIAYGTQNESGLSVQNVRADDPQLMARMLPEYQFCRIKDPQIYCWILSGERNGTGADGEPTIDANTITVIGRVSDELIAQCSAFSTAYNRKISKYAYNAHKPETFARNAEIDEALNCTWSAIEASNAAAALGSIRTEKKSAASRSNGRKGGRPRKRK